MGGAWYGALALALALALPGHIHMLAGVKPRAALRCSGEFIWLVRGSGLGWGGVRVRVLLGAAAGLVTDERRACSARAPHQSPGGTLHIKSGGPSTHRKFPSKGQAGLAAGRQAGRQTSKQAGSTEGEQGNG